MSFFYPETLSARPRRIFWPLSGLVIVLAAESATALLLRVLGPVDILFYLAAPMAALLVGIPAWYHFIVAPGHATVKRGLLLGSVCSIIAHPVMWISLSLFTFLSPPSAASLSFAFLPIEILYSLLFGGWITTPIGAGAGVLLVYLQRALTHTHTRRLAWKARESRKREMNSTESMLESNR